MKKLSSKLAAFLLIAVMVVSLFPASVFADDTDAAGNDTSNTTFSAYAVEGAEDIQEELELLDETDTEAVIPDLNAGAFYQEYTVGDLKVTVSYEAGTVPEGTEVIVTDAKPEAVEAVKAEKGEDIGYAGADISFVFEGKEIEPKDFSDNKVTVKLEYVGEDNLTDADFETLHVNETLDENGEVVYGVETVEAMMTDVTKTVPTYTEVPVYETREITEEQTIMVTKTREVEKTKTVKVKVKVKWYDPSTWSGYKYETQKYTVTETYEEPVTETVVVGTEEVQVGTETVEDGTEEIVVGQTAVFETGEFTSYVISWGQRSYRIYYVDTNGNSLTPARTPTFNNGTYKYLIYDIEGYEYDSCHYGSRTGTAISPLLAVYGNDRVYYNDGWYYLRNDVYVVYKAKSTPTNGGTVPPPAEETWPEGNNTPQFSKSSTNNGNGTNTITLSIAAGEKAVENKTKANVIVVFDSSGSMSYNMAGGSQTSQSNPSRLTLAKNAINRMATTLAGKTDAQGNKLVNFALVNFNTTASRRGDWTDNATTFAGNTYLGGINAGGGTNWEQALAVANRITVHDSDAATFVIFITDGDPTFRVSRGDVDDSVLNGNNMMRTTESSASYVTNAIFGDGNNDPEPYQLNFNAAVEEVKDIVAHKKNFYAIGVSNDVTKVQNLVTEAGLSSDKAILASNQAQLDAAFDKIVESISSALGFGDVNITDGITELTNAEMKVMESVDPNSFKYYRWGGEGNKYGADEAHMTEWTTREADGCAPATYSESDGAVHWNMGSGFQLENQVHYVVTFRVWPSQEAYDLVAELNNQLIFYDYAAYQAAGGELSEEDARAAGKLITASEKAQVVENADGTYALKTNTNEVNATYKKTTKTGDTVTISDTTPITATYHEGTIDNMALESMPLTIKKEFEDDLTAGDDRVDSVVLVLRRRNAHTDGAEFVDYSVPVNGQLTPNITLNEDNDWTYTLYVAPGVEANGQVLEHGYDFTLAEPGIDYHYGLIEEIINPMVVDGQDRYYGDGYLIDDQATYEQYVDRSLTGVNRVKSGIDIQKILVDDAGVIINSDEEFTITGKLLDADGDPYTWSDGDDANNSGAYHKFSPAPEGTPAEDIFTFDDFGYGTEYIRTVYKGHFASSDNISFTLKPGEFIRFINVPEGSTFEFTESSTMPAGYELKEVTALAQHRVSAGGAWTQDGDVQPVVTDNVAKLVRDLDADPPLTGVVGNKQYVVSITNKSVHGEYFFVYHSSDNTIEKIFADDERVEKELDPATNKYTYTFDIAAEVKGGDGEIPTHLYGGYFKAYGGQVLDDDGIRALIYDSTNWAADTHTAIPYTGSKATSWKAANAYTVKGKAMHPVGGTVYYLKEVPNSYLRPYVQIVYDENDDNKILKLYRITALDDANYTQAGFFDGSADASSTKLSATLKITKNGKTVTTLTAKGVFNGKTYPDGSVTVPRGYLTSIEQELTGFSMQPYWKTLDGVKVYGVTDRTVSIGNGYFTPDAEGKAAEPGLTISNATNVKSVE